MGPTWPDSPSLAARLLRREGMPERRLPARTRINHADWPLTLLHAAASAAGAAGAGVADASPGHAAAAGTRAGARPALFAAAGAACRSGSRRGKQRSEQKQESVHRKSPVKWQTQIKTERLSERPRKRLRSLSAIKSARRSRECGAVERDSGSPRARCLTERGAEPLRRSGKARAAKANCQGRPDCR